VTPGDITLDMRPPLFPGQRATVTLQAMPGQPDPGPTISLQLVPVARGAPPQATVVLPRPGIPDGTWLLRLQVDGVDSQPELVGETYGAPALVLT